MTEMVFQADSFIFEPPSIVAFSRKVLIKPDAASPQPHPFTTSRETLSEVIASIRRVSDADIILLTGSHSGEPMHDIYEALGYDFPRTHLLDVRDCTCVEVENPLSRPFAMPTFWVPNIVLACDFSITIAPFKVIGGYGSFSISNLLGLLPIAKYSDGEGGARELWQRIGLHNVIADLYFTLPFDLGIIDARKRLTTPQDPAKDEIEQYGKVFVGQPYEVDCEASKAAGVETRYLRLIEKAKDSLRAYG
jgi:hypothetical protein